MTSMHVRDVPDEVHAELVRRADDKGMTLRQYVIEVFSTHVARPTPHEWIDRVIRRRARVLRPDAMSAADAVAEGRREVTGRSGPEISKDAG